MAKRTCKQYSEAGKRYVLRDRITKVRMEKIKKHPQSDEYFRFKKAAGSLWFWYIRANDTREIKNGMD